MSMRRFAIAGVASIVAAAATTVVFGDMEMPEPPKPTSEHAWLQQLVGEWTSESEIPTGPGQDPMVCHGKEVISALGEFWIVSEFTGTTPEGGKAEGRVTMGYDPDKKAFVGTWVDNMLPHMWVYEGSLDEAGKVLTLNCEGPNFLEPGKMANYKDVTELTGPDDRVVTSWAQGPDGEWVQFATIRYHRVK